jgi:hypothetical protein
MGQRNRNIKRNVNSSKPTTKWNTNGRFRIMDTNRIQHTNSRIYTTNPNSHNTDGNSSNHNTKNQRKNHIKTFRLITS